MPSSRWALQGLEPRPRVWHTDGLPGSGLEGELRASLAQADLVVLVIDREGPRWLHQAVGDALGKALRGGTPLLPVLLDDARMPSPDELLPPLAVLRELQALELPLMRSRGDALRLVAAHAQRLLAGGRLPGQPA